MIFVTPPPVEATALAERIVAAQEAGGVVQPAAAPSLWTGGLSQTWTAVVGIALVVILLSVISDG